MADLKQMDQAAESAASAWKRLAGGMTDEERAGAKLTIQWLRLYFRTAGYKRLVRYLLHDGEDEILDS